MRGGEGGCLPERCCERQDGETPLHFAALYGHAAVVGLLLAAGATVDFQDEVRGGGEKKGEGWVAEHSSACPLGFVVVKFGFKLASRIRTGIGHVTTV